MTNGQHADGDVVVDGVTIRYHTNGEGQPVVVFVHGVYVGGSLWDAVAGRLDGMRCILPTWPLGAHRDPAPNADVSARATARRIPAFLEALDLRDVTLVGNNTGGGLCLAALGSGHAGVGRIGRLVLTNCDSYEHFPPKGFDRIAAIARRFPPAGAGLLRLFATKPGQRQFLKAVCTSPPTGDAARRVFEAFPDSKGARHDALRLTQSLDPSVTLDAVDALKAFSKPVLLAWGDRDKLFPLDHARRLESDFPNARLQVIEGASTYVMLDRPDELASAITTFATPDRDAP
jgi:pimeloyl-ACP methyl ester carboxylesterase